MALYKVIIADDEPLVLIGLQSIIDWQEHDMEIVGTAKNGEQAISLIEKCDPDIVITDIKMPLKTGLEVIEHSINKLHKNPKFIILTSYDEFEFAKKALQLNAVDYLIKLELTSESLLSALKKAVAALNKHSTKPSANSKETNTGLANFKDKFFMRLYNNLFDSEAQFLTQKNNLQLEFNSNSYTVAYCRVISPKKIDTQKLIKFFTSSVAIVADTVQKYLPCYITSLDTQSFCICYCTDDLKEIEKSLQQASQLVFNYFSASLYCYIGVPVHNIIDANISYNSAKTVSANNIAEANIVFANPGDVKIYNDFNVYKEQLTLALENLDKQLLNETILKVIKHIESKPEDFSMALNILTGSVYLIISLLSDGENILNIIFKDEPESYRCIYNCKNTLECCKKLEQINTQLCSNFLGGRKSYKQKIVLNVQQYINANLGQKLSLQDIAAEFNFTPSYLSKIFTEYASCSFVEYVTKERISRAKQRLLEGDTKIYEIAQELGFENTFYFSKVFKKYTGLSPRDYMHQK